MSGRMIVKFWADDAGYIPQPMTDGAAGLDLRARISGPLNLWTGHAYTIRTGVHVAIPEGYVGMVCPRSGMSALGIRAGNSPGIIDSDYRGEIAVILKNDTHEEFTIEPGQRIAQLLVLPCPVVFPEMADSLEDLGSTERGSGGFGSTG